jgi:hypothetical protein
LIKDTLCHRILENNMSLTSDIYNYLNHPGFQLHILGYRAYFRFTRGLVQDKLLKTIGTEKISIFLSTTEFNVSQHMLPFRKY